MFTTSLLASLSEGIFTLIEGLLCIRIVLKFLGANPFTPFVLWVYRTSNPLLAPFEGIFPSATPARGFVLEVSALFALLVYAFLGYFITEAILRIASLKAQVRNK